MKKLVTTFFVSIFCFFYSFSQNSKHLTLKEIQNEYISILQTLTKNTVGVSAPVAGRSFNYFFLGTHEVLVGVVDNINSFDKKLVNYERKVYPDQNSGHQPELIYALTAEKLLHDLYFTMSKSDSLKFYQKSSKLISTLTEKADSEAVKKAKIYTDEFVEEFSEFANSDKGKNGVLENFPEDYKITNCDSCWVRTMPNFLPAQNPYWGKNNLLVLNNIDTKDSLRPMQFSKNENSELFLEALEIYKLQGNATLEQEVIAKYWNDAPGHSGTPVGHFFSILNQLFEKENTDFSTRSKWYAILGLTLNDAIIKTWGLKYKHNFIRPITYIHKYISTSFNSIISTPPFPEYPSGHSVQAGAASTVFNQLFSEKHAFIDSTHINRTDIIGDPRSFDSFDDFAEELSISRWYGGIHFRKTLDESLVYGRYLGSLILEDLIKE